jgi:hypothetical protein
MGVLICCVLESYDGCPVSMCYGCPVSMLTIRLVVPDESFVDPETATSTHLPDTRVNLYIWPISSDNIGTP